MDTTESLSRSIPVTFSRRKPTDRAAVVDQLMHTKDREGVFGKYSIDGNGDISLTPYGIYRIEHGALVFDHSVKGQS